MAEANDVSNENGQQQQQEALPNAAADAQAPPTQKNDSNSNNNGNTTDTDPEGLIPLCIRHPEGPSLHASIYGFDIQLLTERPWARPGADISQYFNYGFDENSWRAYCAMQPQGKNSLKAKADEFMEQTGAAYRPQDSGVMYSGVHPHQHHHHHHVMGYPQGRGRGGGGGRGGNWQNFPDQRQLQHQHHQQYNPANQFRGNSGSGSGAYQHQQRPPDMGTGGSDSNMVPGGYPPQSDQSMGQHSGFRALPRRNREEPLFESA